MLEDLEIQLDSDDSVSTFPGDIRDATLVDLDGDANETPVRVMERNVFDTGMAVVAFKNGQPDKTFLETKSLGTPVDVSIAHGDLETSDDEVYPKDEVVYGSLFKADTGSASFASIYVLDQNMNEIAGIDIDLAPGVVTGYAKIHVETGDLDGDGDDEIAVVIINENETQLHVLDWEYVFLSPGLVRVADKTLQNRSTWVSTATGDIDRDFKDELVLGYETFSAHQEVVAFRLKPNGELGFHSRAAIREGSMLGTFWEKDGTLVQPFHIAVADVNGDTLKDVIAVGDYVVPETVGKLSRSVDVVSLSGNPNRSGYQSLLEYDSASVYPLRLSTIISQELESYFPNAESDSIFSMQAGDLDLDGISEVVLGLKNGTHASTSILRAGKSGNSQEFTHDAGSSPEVDFPNSSSIVLNLADTDGDSLTASLGAPQFGLPACTDTTNPDFSLEAGAPPFWRNTKDYQSGYVVFGKSHSTGEVEGSSTGTSRADTISWSTTVGAKKTIAAVSVEIWATYSGNKHQQESNGRAESTTTGETVNYGIYSGDNTVVGLEIPMRCYNYSAYFGLAPIFPDANVDEEQTDDDAIPVDGALFGQEGGLFRYCVPSVSDADESSEDSGKVTKKDLLMTNAVSADTWEMDHSLYGGGGVIDSQYAVIRPDWSSIALFMDHRTSQSSGSGSGNAVDGLLSRGETDPVALTDVENKPWWQVDLGESRPVSSVRVLAGDENLSNVVVFLSDQDLSKLSEDPVALSKEPGVLTYAWNRNVAKDFSVATYLENSPAKARYVRVQRTDDQSQLALTEVQVFGLSELNAADYPLATKVDPDSESNLDPINPLSGAMNLHDNDSKYKVFMYDRYENTYKWVDQRGTMLMDFDDDKFNYPVPKIQAGTSRQTSSWKTGVATGITDSVTLEESTTHGFSVGAGVGADVNVFGIGDISVYVKAEAGKSFTEGVTNSMTNGTTISDDIMFEVARGGFATQPKGYVSSDGDERFAKYSPQCTYTYTPNLSHRTQIANSGYLHSFLSIDYVVPNLEAHLDRKNGNSHVCGLGGYRFEANKRPTVKDSNYYKATPPGTPIDIDVLENVKDSNEYQKLAVYGIKTAGTVGSVELINPGKLNLADNSVSSLIRYTPRQGAVEGEMDSFEYTVTDGELTKTSTVKILVEQQLKALPDKIEGTIGVPMVADVLGNDSASPSKEKKVTEVSADSEHTKVVLKDGVVTVTPLKKGEDSFTYTVEAGEQKQTVKVDVTAEPKVGWNAFERLEVESGALICLLYVAPAACPVVVVDSASSNGAYVGNLMVQSARIELKEVDFGAAEGPLTLTGALATTNKSGSFRVKIDGTTVGEWQLSGEPEFTFDIDGDYTGKHDVQVEIPTILTEPGLAIDYLQFERKIPDPVEAPVANDDDGLDVIVGERTAVDVLKNDTDPADRPLTVTSVSKVESLNVELEGGKVFVTPSAPGKHSFKYTISNGSKTATANVTVTATAKPTVTLNAFDRLEAEDAVVECPPFAVSCPDIVIDGNHGHVSLKYGGTSLLFKNVDFGASGKELSLEGVRMSASRWGTVKLYVDDTVVPLVSEGKALDAWTLKEGGVSKIGLAKTFKGVHDVKLVLAKDAFTDPGLELDYIQFKEGSGNGQVPPTNGLKAVADKVKSFVGKSAIANVLRNDEGADGKPLTVTSVTQGEHSKVELKNGTVTVTPFGNALEDSFTYTVSDGSQTATATVKVESRWDAFGRIEVEGAEVTCPDKDIEVCTYVVQDDESSGKKVNGLDKGAYLGSIKTKGTSVNLGKVDFGSVSDPLTLTGYRAASSRWGKVTLYVDDEVMGTYHLTQSGLFKFDLEKEFEGVHDVKLELAETTSGEGLDLDFIGFERTPEPR